MSCRTCVSPDCLCVALDVVLVCSPCVCCGGGVCVGAGVWQPLCPMGAKLVSLIARLKNVVQWYHIRTKRNNIVLYIKTTNDTIIAIEDKGGGRISCPIAKGTVPNRRLQGPTQQAQGKPKHNNLSQSPSTRKVNCKTPSPEWRILMSGATRHSRPGDTCHSDLRDTLLPRCVTCHSCTHHARIRRRDRQMKVW